MNELVALVRLLGNFSMMDDACVTVGQHLSEVLELITSESDVVKRQVWTVLLNLSCNKQCLDVILRAESVKEDLVSSTTLFLQDGLDKEAFADAWLLLQMLKRC
ncbi:unnamed protein product [Hydatigera taeniaeformis]|uniref:Arm_2 domain-containing protein n=1 Tax=Hydatigena taeniaeformis TaxID=6205 RepID=A0A0R3X9Y4_HYDTA|nr:unnamed protein product [Hydatigera taeniaeformis]